MKIPSQSGWAALFQTHGGTAAQVEPQEAQSGGIGIHAVRSLSLQEAYAAIAQQDLLDRIFPAAHQVDRVSTR